MAVDRLPDPPTALTAEICDVPADHAEKFHLPRVGVPSAVMAQAVNSRGPVTGTATTAPKRPKFALLDLYGTAVGKKHSCWCT